MTVYIKHNLFLLMIFCLGLTAGLLFTSMYVPREYRGTYFVAKNMYANGKHLINPLLRIDSSQGNDPRLESAKYELIQYIDTSKGKGDILAAAVYLMDLNKGTWIGINEETMFAMASLVKVPIMMAYLKKAELDPSILDSVITYGDKMESMQQNMQPNESAQPGNAYTVRQLLHFMIAHSDNVSMALLFENMDKKFLDELCTDLQLPILNLRESDSQVSVQDYATSLRVLYNASYLGKAMSEKALQLLTDTDFNDGIRAGVPSNLIVAHKFGEREYVERGIRELHECGIVYHEERPYLLCIMTKGRDFDRLKGAIRGMTKIAHDHMGRRAGVL